MVQQLGVTWGLVSLDVPIVSGGRRVDVTFCCGVELYGLPHLPARHGLGGAAVSTGDDQGVGG